MDGVTQTPGTPVRRRRVAHRAALALSGALLVPALGLLLAAPATATATPEPGQPTGTQQPTQQPSQQPVARERSVFSGTLVGQPELVGGVIPTYVYRVEVEEVFTPSDITMQRVVVRSRVALETCGSLSGGQQSGPGGEGASGGGDDTPSGSPTTPGGSGTATGGGAGGGAGQGAGGTGGAGAAAGQAGADAAAEDSLILFDTRTSSTGYQVGGCGRVTRATPAVVARVETTLGPGRAPVIGGEPETDPFAEVDYLCPGTHEPITDLGATDPADCEVLADTEPPAVDRALAPGAALVVVGLLGLVVARRFDRR